MTKRIVRIDALRALAILLVVFAHTGIRITPGGYGVTLFFVISGFIISALLIKEFDRTQDFNYSFFLIRRALKILPPLIFIIIIPSLLLIEVYKINLNTVLTQILFTYNWFKIFHGATGVLPGSQVVWSLAIEEQFYLLLCLFWFFSMKRPKTAKRNLFVFAALLWVTSTISRFHLAWQHLPHDETGNTSRIFYGSDTRMSAIASGIILAFVVQNTSKYNLAKLHEFMYSKWSCWLAILLLVVSLSIRGDFFRDSFRFNLQELASVVFVAGATQSSSWPRFFAFLADSRIIKIIGLSSY